MPAAVTNLEIKSVFLSHHSPWGVFFLLSGLHVPSTFWTHSLLGPQSSLHSACAAVFNRCATRILKLALDYLFRGADLFSLTLSNLKN